MRKSNYHMHTKRCMHASGSDEAYVVAAIANGYEEIGFSDHCPWPYASDFVANMRMSLAQFDGYHASVLALKEKYKDQISIKIGLECEYFPIYMDWLKQFIKEKQLDYVIFGNHYYKSDESRVYFGTACSEDDMLEAYVEECIAGMETGIYAYLAHPELFMRGRKQFNEAAIKASYQICEAAKRLDIPLEYNLAGAAYDDLMKTTQYPHPKFWEIVAEVGNVAIIGVDAHEPKAMATDQFRDAGITYLQNLGIHIVDELPQSVSK